MAPLGGERLALGALDPVYPAVASLITVLAPEGSACGGPCDRSFQAGSLRRVSGGALGAFVWPADRRGSLRGRFDHGGAIWLVGGPQAGWETPAAAQPTGTASAGPCHRTSVVEGRQTGLVRSSIVLPCLCVAWGFGQAPPVFLLPPAHFHHAGRFWHHGSVGQPLCVALGETEGAPGA